ncbi:NUDIX domain-containing protein [Citricoccus muralis]|uniref:NUDIX hydrolase n=1 Tax=Citricoccus muralis TaxID=169134 RepID=A0ABY8H3J3_9MICC|nr:NUDIX hydrolase [Citricoccus muralis]WFP15586.1 NUDIX hydrolase [Citricoccus muralis]
MTNTLDDSDTAPVRDVARSVPVQDRHTAFGGAIWSVQRETFTLEDEQLTREFVEHPGAVAVVALDDKDQVCLVRQYRHPVRSELWEIPAGLLDVPGESLVDAARRELAEEADLSANDWSVLMDHYPTPGSSSEAIRIFLARGLQEIPAEQRHAREAEEAHMIRRWVPLDEAVTAALNGCLHNANTLIGVMAARLRTRNPDPDQP